MAERTLTTGEPGPGGTLRDALVRSRLWIAAEVFFFLGFVFAYVYLRVLNVNHKWRPPHTKPPLAMGTVAFALIVASALLSAMALRRMRAGAIAAWRGISLAGLVLGLTAVSMAGWELSHLSFSASQALFAFSSLAASAGVITRTCSPCGRSRVVIDAFVQRPCKSGSPKLVRGAW